METQLPKNSVLDAFAGILPKLTIKEIEELQDDLSVQLHKLTDNGKRTTLDEVKKDLDIV